MLERIPKDARRVGLVGAAVSDHPRIVEIVSALADRGSEVGLSSLRPDRLKDEFVEALHRAGYRTLTTALDGASERLRGLIERRGREQHYVAGAERAKKHGMDRMKLYLMIGLPGETDDDIDECARFVGELSRILPIALGVAPFCAKKNTPLDRMPFAGMRTRGLAPRAPAPRTQGPRRRALDQRALGLGRIGAAQGGTAEGIALAKATREGGRFADFRKAFAELGHKPDGEGYADATMPIAPELAGMKRLVIARA